MLSFHAERQRLRFRVHFTFPFAPADASDSSRPPLSRPPPLGYRAHGCRCPSFARTGILMADRPFVHLHCHTHYSLLDGASRVPELVATVKGHGMNACAMTDHGNMFGAIEFYKECKDGGINPIVGYEAYVAPGARTEREAKRR